MKPATVIIGAGISGLVTALLLGRSGRRVVVLEQAKQPAPVIRGFQRDGIRFDTGFHYAGGFGAGGPLQLFFRHLGLADGIRLIPCREEGFDQLRIAASGRTYELPVGFAAIRAYLGSQFPAAAKALKTYLDEVEAQWRYFPYLDPSLDIRNFKFQTVHSQSLQERLAVFSAWPDLQTLLSMHTLLYGVAPSEAAHHYNAQVAGSYYHSAHLVDGGGRALLDALLNQLAGYDVELRCGAEVFSIEAAAGRVAAVVLSGGERLAADEVVATVNPELVARWLADTIVRPAYLKRLRGLQQTCSAFVVCARSEQARTLLSRRNLICTQSSGPITADCDASLEQRSFFLAGANCSAGNSDAAGLIGIFPARLAEVSDWKVARTQRSAAYREWKHQFGEQLLAHIAERCPELDDLQLSDLATPLTIRHFSGCDSGALYGTAHCIGQYNPHPVTRLPGFYLSGQAVSAPGLLGAMLSAYVTCGAVIGPETLQGELQKCL